MLLEVVGLSKNYGPIQALDAVSLELGAGEVLGLVGPNGAGKTTLFSIIAGTRRPTRGQVLVNGEPVLGGNWSPRDVALASQDLAVYPTLTVRENLRVFAELCHGRGARAVIDETLERLRLVELQGRFVGHLSGGQRRLVHAGMAVVCRPRLLLLDEPTAGGDVNMRENLLQIVRELADDGVAICYSTHYFAEVEALDATVVILDRGRIRASGSIATLRGRYASPAVELVFADEVPALQLDRPTSVVDGTTLRVWTPDPAAELPALVDAVGEARASLRSISIVEPSLDAIYAAVTTDTAGAVAE